MDAEKLQAATDLKKRIDAMKEHRDKILKRIEERKAKFSGDDVKKLYIEVVGTRDSYEEKLFSDFLPITQADIIDLYLLKVNAAIEAAEKEFSEL